MKNSFVANTTSIEQLLEEIRVEQKISPLRNISELENILKEGIYDIEYNVGNYIDFDVDLQARSLLKDYVLFADHNMKSKFKEEYSTEYINLQFKYNKDSNI